MKRIRRMLLCLSAVLLSAQTAFADAALPSATDRIENVLPVVLVIAVAVIVAAVLIGRRKKKKQRKP